MLYDYKEVIAIYGNDYNLKKALSDKRIFKVEKGIYKKLIFYNYPVQEPQSIQQPTGRCLTDKQLVLPL